ncbi:MAG: terminase family protein [Candidatus Solibacter sp.]
MWKILGKTDSRRESRKRVPAAVAEPGIREWAQRQLGFDPDPVQERLLTTKKRRVVLNCTRQWGKSTVTAAKAVYQATHEAESLTIVVSPSARQTGEFLRKASKFVRRLGAPVRGDGDNEMSLMLPNRSRIVGLPGNEATVRGFSAVSLLLVDEASRVDDELYRAVRPMLIVSGGALWLMSTPFGKRGFFYETWTNGGDEWERVQVKAAECSRIRPELLKEERRTMGDLWFRQEYECEFVDAVSGVFDRDLVEGAITSEVKPLDFD